MRIQAINKSAVQTFRAQNNINFDKDLFTKEELELINYVLMKTEGKSAKQLSDWSHYFKGWIDTDMGKEINMKKYAKYFDINNL